MVANKQRLTNALPPHSSHVEVVTENGFGIARVCELAISRSDSVNGCHFVVGLASGGVRSITVEFGPQARTQVQEQLNPLPPTSHFWLHCAERHLAAYIWENDGCPPDGRLVVDLLSVEDLLQAAQWDKC
ncbi:MAG TPA: hypothetical protein VK208_20225 [Pyrinomonadaceae bacterium]|jgi:hypothetical protein|nr:hypothetical protein [Pyrinomonadaceae bacterium]